MGFFDNFEDTSGASFIGKDEKEELIKDATVLPVLRISLGESQYGERYLVTVDLDGEERAITFNTGSVESRDRMLAALANYLDSEDAEPVSVVVSRVGRSLILKNPDSE